MADASCGPSNAFKGLARHIEQDRSHQQDRVTSSFQHPAQNFRSAPLNSGSADQFSAFQQQNAAIPQYPQTSWGPLPHPPNLATSARSATFSTSQPTQQAPALAQNATVSAGWLSEFQSMNLSNAHASSLRNKPAPGPAIGLPAFYEMPPQYPLNQHLSPPSMGLHPINQQLGNLPLRGNTHVPELMNNTPSVFDTQAQADLDQEFEDAMNEWMLHNAPEPEAKSQNEFDTQSGVDLTANLDAASAEPTAQEASKEDSTDGRDQDTELARAAQQLVDSVADNDSDKFKNSEFLALMRRIASQQLTVQGNDLVERPQPSSSTDTTSANP
ncbi:hypothetical protein O1611_g4566 [Lasiodiplodia mahajangana]|uniref:Uncharacterized protein n=1 Tax=Lasiodiplodia mahajangana TaxID=1108764 RepID=A0ACC2JNH4_9PEZI|nr:hypothetical protein O1611_g4566 [Lasiodiplodia mahajangana]